MDDFEFTEHQTFKDDEDKDNTTVQIHKNGMSIIYSVLYRASVADDKEYSHDTLYEEAMAVGQDIAEAFIYLDDLDDEDTSTHTDANMDGIKEYVRLGDRFIINNYFVDKVSEFQMKTIAGGVLMTYPDDGNNN